MKTRNI